MSLLASEASNVDPAIIDWLFVRMFAFVRLLLRSSDRGYCRSSSPTCVLISVGGGLNPSKRS
jgi:hypothetical protein